MAKKNSQKDANGLNTKTLGMPIDLSVTKGQESIGQLIEKRFAEDPALARQAALIVKFLALGDAEFSRLVENLDGRTPRTAKEASNRANAMLHFIEEDFVPLNEAMVKLFAALSTLWSDVHGVMGPLDVYMERLLAEVSSSSGGNGLALSVFGSHVKVSRRKLDERYRRIQQVSDCGKRIKQRGPDITKVLTKLKAWLGDRRRDMTDVTSAIQTAAKRK